MTKRSRGKGPPANPAVRTQSISGKKPFLKSVLILAVIVIAAGLPFGLGKYIEFNLPDAYDSGAYIYSAKHILDGAKIGVDEKPSAQIGTLLVNILGVWMFGFNETGPTVVQAILQAGALVLMFIAMRRLFGGLAAGLGVTIAAIYLSAPLIAKFGNVKEQYMIAFMVMAISCFVIRQLGGKWVWAVLAGALVSWAPLFKPTGTSAIGAMVVFVLCQPFLKNRSWKETLVEIGLLLAGAAAAIGPIYIWMLAAEVKMSLPYSFVWKTLGQFLPTGGTTAKAAGGYVVGGRKLIPFAEQWPRVLRYYGLLILPIALATGAIVTRIAILISRAAGKGQTEAKKYDRFVLLLAIWWILDMAFVWISPRSYEQYYLPLTGSAAMLGGYLIALYSDKLSAGRYAMRWQILGLAGFLVMMIMAQHIFLGVSRSPHTGRKYAEKQRGYLQGLRRASQYRKGAKGSWQRVGEYMRTHSRPSDKIYVWGWFPGIYVQAQRFSSASRAFCMTRIAPKALAATAAGLLAEFEREMPKFIVDTRKREIPTNRPPLELWPIVAKGMLGATQTMPLPANNKPLIARYDREWSKLLRGKFDEDEALRYEALKPFREFVMNNYRIVRPFGEHILLQLKTSTKDQE
ncbi:MAG: ArnT family glycosyltransferase [Planctomycetota bacterium]|jgi:hypothetical protein